MNDAQTLFNEGVTALQAGQMEKARRLLARSIAIEPLNEHAWLFLSLTLPDTKAADALERVLRINPANASAQAALDAVHKRLGKEASPAAMAVSSSQSPLEQGNKPTQKFNT